ncbi:hypothetical protein SODALDRAFT_130207 [Sodiomyces alkalinus F11]|uniref:Uncharacterized protein n=1 Tax=Sodiomyces alkalinus (strain CBS 110278 / VKM F-3762 / F11) TaxID=1314773 RepID=A0A3N2PIS5_SODAK|nr:hypothetical protein SODALDRAFT_130207 [Sodiomyces alkalinus F11]ROT34449.1 hypothetical protein SODALDRAFT_130207 [Sodiomyces alkalinus F11]
MCMLFFLSFFLFLFLFFLFLFFLFLFFLFLFFLFLFFLFLFLYYYFGHRSKPPRIDRRPLIDLACPRLQITGHEYPTPCNYHPGLSIQHHHWNWIVRSASRTIKGICRRRVSVPLTGFRKSVEIPTTLTLRPPG